MKKIHLLPAFAVFLTLACAKKEDPNPNSAKQGDPGNIPENLTLYSPSPVLIAQFEATPGNLAIKAYRTMGSPTKAADLGRDILLVALGTQNDTVHALSIDNPRAIHTAGARDPKTDVLDTARFMVAFPNLERISSLSVEVRSGPDSGLKKSFPVDPAKLPTLEQVEAQRPIDPK